MQQEPLSKSEYDELSKRLDELKDIEHWDDRCDEFNEIHDKVIAYENENNIFVAR